MPKQGNAEIRVQATHEGAFPPALGQRESGHLLEPFIVLAKHKFLILFTVGGVALLTAVISLLLPNDYTAQSRILPPKENTSIASAMLGQFGPLLGATGKDLGIHNPNDMYVAMLRSRTVADALIDQFSLMNIYHKKLRVDARKRLDAATEINAGRDDVITISVEDRDPGRASDIANAYVVELGKLTRTLAITDASKRRLFFEHEVKTASDELATAEDALKATQQSTGIIQ
ncbi:MAG TPA: Wzz/FepE/Etk N-terminal domain-containing protein, partial [Acidobacteriaceae bacterium]|nr:Wzz/FepE/Etk N-terminal domain-containing protein [Acidobacteriaceae bacterium]